MGWGTTGTFCAVKPWLLLELMGLSGYSSAVSIPHSKLTCVHRDRAVSWGGGLEAFLARGCEQPK